jgi:hypothetical protein
MFNKEITVHLLVYIIIIIFSIHRLQKKKKNTDQKKERTKNTIKFSLFVANLYKIKQ